MSRLDALVYEHRTTGKLLEREEASPSDRDWRRFWASDGYRGDENGERWLLQLGHGDRRIQSSGTGAFPPISAPTPSPEFLRLCAATAKLVGEILLPPQ